MPQQEDNQFPKLPWIDVEETDTIELRISGLWFWISRRPPYCDRGEYLAHVEAAEQTAVLKLDLDQSDLWPRYYFDRHRMLLEIEAWIAKRGFWPQTAEEGQGYEPGT